ncbi:ATP-binding protein [Solidesulfovibrio alcoholivorans]|uniref:ATP-binding protein n=1 Tax=Solidesulfovibrio alcoholivorans TaxID=81406 RepID=UPI0004955409|nr:ATP-binding protein [Solidesulfovibrio alcoholivorans]
MRGASLRVKINLAIFLAFLAAAAAFGGVLSYYMGTRQEAAQSRTRLLLGTLAAHRLEALGPMLGSRDARGKALEIMNRLVRVDGVVEASLFGAHGELLATAGEVRPGPLTGDDGGPGLPGRRIFSVSTDEEGKIFASLVEPVSDGEQTLGYLRLRYSLREITELNQHTWFVFALAVVGAYVLLAALLNLMLHLFVLHPVDEMRQGLEAVHAGRLDVALPVGSRDALGRMAMAFNAMAARLKETSESLARSQAEVEENRLLLARRVDERTAELALANERLTDEIVARKDAESRQERALALHKAILESKTEGVLCVGLGGDREVLAVNARFLELWRLPGDWLTQERPRRVALVLGKLAAPQASEEAYEKLMAEPRRQDVAVLALRDGRFFERRSGPILQGESCIGRVFSYVDVTEEKKRQDAVEREKNRAEDASKAKGAFLAVMSHEIRTPLNVVIGLTEELLSGPASESQRGHLRSVREAAAHLLGVVNDVLDFSKIEAGKLVLERGEVDLRRLLDGVVAVFAHEAAQKGLAFTAAVDDDVPAVLLGDAGRLRQILVNLTANALKFTAAGAVSVRVSLAAKMPGAPEDGRTALALRVTDTGPGMDAAECARLFQDFEQGAASTSRRFGGTGLGLAIAKGLAVRMGGDLTVESRLGEGSAFTCTVRLAPAGGNAVAAPAPAPPPAAAVHEPLRILLVEDNALNAAVARLHMGRMGHELTVAASAREAWEILARERFDVVLMDIEMPEVDGITAARTIRAGGPEDAPVFDPDVPIIAVTAHALEDMRQECLEAGMNGFVSKPINFQVLRDALDAAARHDGGAAAAPAARPVSVDALFDPDTARQGMDIDREQFLDLCRVSFEEGTRRLAACREAMAAGDMARAIIDAHTLKGTAATLGAYSCRERARALEKALRTGDADAAGKAHVALSDLWRELGPAFAVWLAGQEGRGDA